MLLAGQGLHLRRAIQIDTHHLGNPARAIAVGLIYLRLEGNRPIVTAAVEP